MEQALETVEYEDYGANFTDCTYIGTDHLEVKIYLIGVFATFIAILSIIFNTFFTLVFLTNQSIRKSSVFYFGILAVIDTVMAVNYIAVMSIPVYMDYYHYLPIYHLFLSYFRLILTESNCAMFSSMLLIVLATTERLLRTFHGETILKARKFLEKHRPSVCAVCILVAVAYKVCNYWEIDVQWKPMCEEGWGQYEIIPGPLTAYHNYRFWWMFITRNALDRILPFFVLVAMNYLIIMALKKEYVRQSVESKPSLTDKKTAGPRAQRGNLRDATRALISVVSMYLMSQSLQVVLTFWETFDRESLEAEGLNVVYSYLNDIVSILTLLSSCLRFPVYCSCNRLISSASSATLTQIKNICFEQKKSTQQYTPITSCRLPIQKDGLQTYVYNPVESPSQTAPEIARVTGAIYDDVLKEWQL
ncbi:hypothetical protein ANCCEY_07913 [Ancylostoma ceylanicum]|uniref:G-protein coupled receptors family 1 profile domain-containing protein n=2 Tax=Ancylostoma ceylanicum TaxID=53326 RepID=A0A0D6LZE4_9BILA|nr:hypothetical protein ANCCEY_07913 [Ancylostoma ceylanicum]EYC13295.1 hypothetical protein Y032_0044g1088 [Ancylostoma ceylanicum]